MRHQHFFSDQQQGFWQFAVGPQLLFGRDELLEKLPQLCGEKRVGLLCDATVERLALTRQFLKKIQGQLVARCSIGSDSDYSDVCAACAEFKAKKVELVLAIGGGSVLDAAKVVAAAFPQEIDPWVLGGLEQLQERAPLIAVPTTFGTGAEANMYGHLYKSESGEKISFKKSWLTPDFALIHPGFAAKMPQRLKYLSGIDAFVHVLEVLTLKRDRSPLLTGLMEQGVQLCLDDFRAYVETSEPRPAEALAQVSILGGIGIHNARTGLIHALAIPYAQQAELPHAESILPFILPALEFNWEQVVGQLPFSSFSACRDQLLEKVLFLPQERAPWQPDAAAIEGLVEKCAQDKVLFKENPRSLTPTDLAGLYRRALADDPQE